jgi:hypothetical protein
MTRVITAAGMAAIACGVLAGSAMAADEANPNNVAAKQCQAEKQAAGNKAFKEIYGGKRAMQQCKRANRGEAADAVENASQECSAEREAVGEEAFNAQYGSNKNGKNAFGKCVSAKSEAEAEENAEQTANASRECRAERTAIGEEAFAEKYGTNENRRNAFGKCVSQAREDDEEEAPVEPAPVA